MTLIACNHEKYVFGSDTRGVIIEKLLEILTPRVDEFDSIALSGYSSTIIGTILADRLGKNVILIRKSTDDRHSDKKVEGHKGERVIFIDDTVASGATLERVTRGCVAHGCTFVGIVLYNHDTYFNDLSWGSFCINDMIEESNRVEVTNYEERGYTRITPWESDIEPQSEGWTI